MKNFCQDPQDLPTTLPLLALQGAVLLPRTQLPIPIDDMDHLIMIFDILKSHQMVGVIQPILQKSLLNDDLPIFKTGCAGKIIDINEVEEGRFVVTLKGICRFEIVEELTHQGGYRQAKVNYSRYGIDCVEDSDFSCDRPRLLKALKHYFKLVNMTPNWQEIDQISNERLITALAMVCPLEAREKQALLETPSPKDQSQLITTLFELATLEGTSTTCH